MLIARNFFILFLALVLAELYAFIKVTEWIGFGYMVLLALATSAIGFLLLQRQGLAMRERVTKALLRGEMLPAIVVEGGMGWIGAFLLIVPGFITDAMGLLCLLPGVRGLLARRLMARGQAYEVRGTGDVHPASQRRRTFAGDYVQEKDSH